MTLKAVRIIHNIKTRIDFSFLAEFFRLAGIYVIECIDNDEDVSSYQNTPDCFDITVDTCGSNNASEYGPAVDFYKIKNIAGGDGLIRLWNENVQKNVLRNVLVQMALLLKKEPPGAGWETLIQNYVAYNLMLHSLNLQYYSKKPSYAIKNVQNVFYALQRDLESDLKLISINNPERKYLEYAKIYSKVKVNAGCKFMNQGFEFPIEELADECRECMNRYPDFSNLKVLLGLCYEYKPVYAPMAIRALVSALEEENQYCYSSHIYYWIGKQYEAYTANWEDSVNSYKRSFKRRHKYKNMYKLAVAHRVACDYEDAISSFTWIIDKLKEKIKLNMLDPLEVEYYFKSKAMIATIYFSDLKDYLGAIEHGESLIRNYNQLVDADDYYNQLYGNEADNYRRLTKQRFDTKRVRSILYYSYHYLGLEEKALQYMNMKDFEENN